MSLEVEGRNTSATSTRLPNNANNQRIRPSVGGKRGQRNTTSN